MSARVLEQLNHRIACFGHTAAFRSRGTDLATEVVRLVSRRSHCAFNVRMPLRYPVLGILRRGLANASSTRRDFAEGDSGRDSAFARTGRGLLLWRQREED